MISPSDIRGISDVLREDSSIALQGNGTKDGLSGQSSGDSRLSLANYSGIVEYNPSEYVFSAKAGTTLADIEEMLLGNRQYLPFDPPFVKAGATLGGMVASGLSGPGSVRFGGVRDFILGISFVTGDGTVLRGGGKVVKNAAGFDLPKFLTGSLGRLAIILEVAFKVFPKPERFLTLLSQSRNLDEGIKKLVKTNVSRWEPDAVELEANGDLFLRFAGNKPGLSGRIRKVEERLGSVGVLSEGDACRYWSAINAFTWGKQGRFIIKVPISPNRIRSLDQAVDHLPVDRRYGLGGNVAMFACPNEKSLLHLGNVLEEKDLGGMVVKGDAGQTFVGIRRLHSIESKIKAVFDPRGLLPNFE